MPSIYLRQDEKTYIAMTEMPFEAEDILQELIERHPEMLVGDDDSHEPLILVSREAGVRVREDGGARWSLDHLYLDAKGIPTLVEVKRSSDTRSRREVVGQMFYYAAHARTSFSAQRMKDWLEESGQRGGETLDAFGIHNDDDIADYWQAVDTNLKAERFRLVFVSDRIHPDLRRIIEFLDSQMTPTDVLAIEVKQYAHLESAHQIIVPRVIGAKEKPPAGPPVGRPWLVAGIRMHSAAAADAAEGVLDWAEEQRLDVRYTPGDGVIETAGRKFLRITRKREIQVRLQTLVDHGEPWDEQSIGQLVRDLADIGFSLKNNRRWAKAPLESLADDTRFLPLMRSALDTLAAP